MFPRPPDCQPGKRLKCLLGKCLTTSGVRAREVPIWEVSGGQPSTGISPGRRQLTQTGTGKSAAVRPRKPRPALVWAPRNPCERVSRSDRSLGCCSGAIWFHDLASQSRSRLEKGRWIHRGLFQNRAERSFGHVARMVRDRCISVRAGVIPDLVTSRGLTIKLESAGLELPDDPR
jgi:hypothetical protein